MTLALSQRRERATGHQRGDRNAFLLFALSCAACGSSGNVFEPARYPTARIAAREALINLADARAHVIGKRTFDTPFMSMPGDDEAKEIALAPHTRAAMQSRMVRVVGAGNASLLVQVTVREGTAGWKASWIAETAYTRVSLRVQVVDGSSGQPLVAASGIAWAERSSMDVSDEEACELFDRAVLRAFEEAITQPDFVPMVNRALSMLPGRRKVGTSVTAQRR